MIFARTHTSTRFLKLGLGIGIAMTLLISCAQTEKGGVDFSSHRMTGFRDTDNTLEWY